MSDRLPAALSRNCRTSEPDVFARALVGADCECTPFPGAPLEATLRQLQLRDVLLIQHVAVGPHISRAALSANLQLLLVPLHQSGMPPHVNGAPVRLNEALLVPGGIEFHCHSPASRESAAIAVPPALLEMWAELSALPVKVRGAASVLALPAGPAQRLAGALSAAGEMARDLPEARLNDDCAANLANSLRDLLMASLTEGGEKQSRSRTASGTAGISRVTTGACLAKPHLKLWVGVGTTRVPKIRARTQATDPALHHHDPATADSPNLDTPKASRITAAMIVVLAKRETVPAGASARDRRRRPRSAGRYTGMCSFLQRRRSP